MKGQGGTSSTPYTSSGGLFCAERTEEAGMLGAPAAENQSKKEQSLVLYRQNRVGATSSKERPQPQSWGLFAA
jgi:hypothetical protein